MDKVFSSSEGEPHAVAKLQLQLQRCFALVEQVDTKCSSLLDGQEMLKEVVVAIGKDTQGCRKDTHELLGTMTHEQRQMTAFGPTPTMSHHQSKLFKAPSVRGINAIGVSRSVPVLNLPDDPHPSVIASDAFPPQMDEAWPGNLLVRRAFHQSHTFLSQPSSHMHMEIALGGMSESVSAGQGEEDPSMSTRRGYWRRQLVLHPTSKLRVSMDMISMLILPYDLIATPYVLAAGLESAFFTNFAWFTAAFWLLDMVSSFFTGFYMEGELVTKHTAIAQRYFRRWFLIDMITTGGDLVDLLLSFTTNADGAQKLPSRLLRLTKLTRLIRLVRLFRMLRAVVGIGNFVFSFLGPMARSILQTVELLIVILWLSHLQSCAWISLGKHAWTDTGVHWLDSPIAGTDELPRGDLQGPATAATYREAAPRFVYVTALHWAMTQVTPGSMQISAMNTAERIYNIACLLVGIVFFSSIISSTASKMTELRLAALDQTQKLRQLDKFLRQRNIPRKMAFSITKHICYKLYAVKPITITDVSLLQLLSGPLQKELLHCVFNPYLMRLHFFHFLSFLGQQVLFKVTTQTAEVHLLYQQDQLFHAGESCSKMYYMVQGMANYCQHPKTCKGVEKESCQPLLETTWLCEASLWVEWVHVGDVDGTSVAEVLALDVAAIASTFQRHELVNRIAAGYAAGFHAHLAASVVPRRSWPTDVDLPFSHEQVVLSMPEDARALVSRVALKHAKRMWRGRWAAQFTARALEGEISEDHTVLILSPAGDDDTVAIVERLSSVAILRLQDAKENPGHLLVEFGIWVNGDGQGQPGYLEATATLPTVKPESNELPHEAIERLLQDRLAKFQNRVAVHMDEEVYSVETSFESGVRTKWLKTVHNASLHRGFRTPPESKVQVLDCLNVSSREIQASSTFGSRKVESHHHPALHLQSSLSAVGSAPRPGRRQLLPQSLLQSLFAIPDSGSRIFVYGWATQDWVDEVLPELDRTYLQKMLLGAHVEVEALLQSDSSPDKDRQSFV